MEKEELQETAKNFSSYAIGDIIPKCLLVSENKPVASRVTLTKLMRGRGDKLIRASLLEDSALIWQNIPEEEIEKPGLEKFFKRKKLVCVKFGDNIVALPKSFEERLIEAHSRKNLTPDEDLDLYLYKCNYLSKMTESEIDYSIPIRLSHDKTPIITPAFKLTKEGRALVGEPVSDDKSFQNYEQYVRKLHDFLFPGEKKISLSHIISQEDVMHRMVPEGMDLCTGYYLPSDEGENRRHIVFTSGEPYQILGK